MTWWMLLAAGTLQAAPTLQRTGDRWVFGDASLAVALDATTGAWVELRQGDRVVASGPAERPAFDLRAEDQWLHADRAVAARLDAVAPDGPRAILATVVSGDWSVACRYAIESPGLLVRTAAITWRGAGPVKLKGFAFRTPTFATDAAASYVFPGRYPPERRLARDFRPGTEGRGSAPTLVQVAADRTVVCLSNERTPHSDRPSVSVGEVTGGLRLGQGFDSLARMAPRSTQTVGDAHLWLLEGDSEAALRRLPEWLTAHGYTVPANRPAWFKDAIPYSFHPGGTIGSGFKDLGGFRAATAFLDRIADLGCNAIWLLPLEDRSPYWPRDYYQFMEGLGTGDEYRALVARAHQLGLRVLQDIVPHGGSDKFQRALDHPEWLAQNEDGSTLNYWSFDFNHPGWREYMAQVARHYVKEYGIDGYRVDAVGGSYIPNWNPNIPYGRASFAKLQGGLNMLRSLRGAVQEVRPDAGLLAEVQGSVYGSESDAVYDFTGCYNVFQDLRRQPPAVFVSRLRRWLHESSYAETPDLLRLRHIESHDSLRSALWYGLAGQRALFALTSWIHGVPLVYHESEEGSRAVLQRIFAIRRALPELCGGAADYLAVDSRADVFACLRTAGDGASVVLINFAGEARPVTATVPLASLPAPLRAGAQGSDLWRDQPVAPRLDAGRLAVTLDLPPLGFTVVALRRTAPPALPPAADPWAVTAGRATPPTGEWVVSGEAYDAVVDPATGLLGAVRVGGREALGPLDLVLASPGEAAVTVRRDGRAVVAERRAGDSRLELRYEPQAGFLRVTARASAAAGLGALRWPVPQASRWFATTAEGDLEDRFAVRHLTTTGTGSNIYWRPQGTNVLYDSLLHPPGPAGGALGALTPAGAVGLRFARPPARAQWLDRLGEAPELSALVAWSDPEAPHQSAAELVIDLVPGLRPGAAPALPAGLRAVGGGWEWSNRHYRLQVSRSGMVRRLTRAGDDTALIESQNVYTDHGFRGSERTQYGAAHDNEAACRVESVAGGVHLIFEGRLRGFQRFDKLEPPIVYRVDYHLGDGPSFRLSCAVKPTASPRGESAFLASQFVVPELTAVTQRRGGRDLVTGEIGDGRERTAASRLLTPPAVPDEVLLRGADAALLRVSELACSGPPTLNVFAHGRQFFLAWLDGPPPTASVAGQWLRATGLWTVGEAAPVALGAAPQLADDGPALLLRDPGFEGLAGGEARAVRTGQPLPGRFGASPWQPPAGGRLVTDPVHGGRLAAEVTCADNSYRLWRQELPLGQLPAGSRWRLSAWVKGRDIQVGDVGWKVGAVRFGLQGQTTTYVAVESLLGTFDWRQVSCELTVPEGLTSLDVQAGLNGANGTLWIDDLTLQRLP